jgi:molybdopterin molybdotransferase
MGDPTYTPTAAATTILSHIRPLPVERLSLLAAEGRVLAEDLISPINLPHWDNSAMDGYAARSVDLRKGAPLDLTVIESIAAGAFPHKEVKAGSCARIFTGAPLPKGADCVIRQEDTTVLEGDRVRIDNTRDAGRNVRHTGEDIKRSETVLQRGTPLGPAEIGVLASLAQNKVAVFGRPQVSIMGSGDEIADLDERDAILAGRKIASSNTYTLISLVRGAGAEPVNLGIAKDDPEDITARLMRAADTDLVVTSAGISVGEHDYMHQVLDDLGIQERFWRIKMRPGAPVGFGLLDRLDGIPWIGLPGNPVSTMVTFELFVRPAVRKMLGHRMLFRRTVPVQVDESITLGTPLRHFLRVVLTPKNGGLSARLTGGGQGSGILTSMVKADALLIVPEDRKNVEVGETLQAIVLDDPGHVEEPPW